MKTNTIIHALIIGTALSSSLTCHAVLSEKTIKLKDLYIGRIQENASDVRNLERIYANALALKVIGIAGGPLGIAPLMLGDALMILGYFSLATQLLTTFVAVDQLDKLIKKEPELYPAMSKDEKKILNSGKAALNGNLLNLIYEKTASDKAIKKAAEEFIQQLPALNTNKTAVKIVANYLTWLTDLKMYDYATQKEQEARNNIKLGLLTPLVQKAFELGDKLFAKPIMDAKIAQKKKNIESLFKKQPSLSDLKTNLDIRAESLFEELKEIKEKYKVNEKVLNQKQTAG